MFAKQAVDAKDNNDTSRANHKEHLANMLRAVGQLDDALKAADELLAKIRLDFSHSESEYLVGYATI